MLSWNLTSQVDHINGRIVHTFVRADGRIFYVLSTEIGGGRDLDAVARRAAQAKLGPPDVQQVLAQFFHMTPANEDILAAMANAGSTHPDVAAFSADKELAPLLIGDGADAVSPFPAVAQPAYFWKEKITDKGFGVTDLPVSKTACHASMTYARGSSPWARSIKLHELLHARYSPEMTALRTSQRVQGTYSEVVLQIAEDVRLAFKAREMGLFEEVDAYVPERAWARQNRQSPRSDIDAAVLFMAAYGQPLEGDWDKSSAAEFMRRLGHPITPQALETLRKWASVSEKVVAARLPEEETFIKLAQATKDALEEIVEDGSGGGSFGPQGGNGAGDAEQPVEMDASGVTSSALRSDAATEQRSMKIKQAMQRATSKMQPQFSKDVMEQISKQVAQARSRPTERTYDYRSDAQPWRPGGAPPPQVTREVAENYSLDVAREAGWGEMKTVLAPLQRNFRALVKRSGPAAPDGPTPRHIHRWYGDKHIFVRQGMRRGGTLLIDISGSMGWQWEDTLKLIEATPAMTIAMYSGGNEDGQLTIIAKDGKLVAKDFNPRAFGHLGNNTVDGPALSWLARQPRPRVWFSDGRIVPKQSINETQGRGAAMRDATRICKLGAIRRTQSTDEVVRIFEGKSVPMNTKYVE